MFVNASLCLYFQGEPRGATAQFQLRRKILRNLMRAKASIKEMANIGMERQVGNDVFERCEFSFG